MTELKDGDGEVPSYLCVRNYFYGNGVDTGKGEK